MSLQVDEENLYSNFINSLKSERTKINYNYALKQYMAFHRFDKYSHLLSNSEERIKEYVIFLNKNNASSTKFKLLFAALKNFYNMNDIENIKWYKLRRFQGEESPKFEDRCYTHEEIKTLLDAANMKMKAVILLMASSGMRIGALPSLSIGDLKRIGDLYRISVYKGLRGKGQYYTFCTPECAKAIDTYISFRERCGEKITETSPLFRKDFDIEIHEHARNRVQPLAEKTLQGVLDSLRIRVGLSMVERTKYQQKSVKLSHGFRKFFVTQLVNAHLDSVIIKKLSGHSVGTVDLTLLYSKQTEEEMLQEYEKAIDALTISPANRLQRKVEMLTVEKSKIDQALAAIEEVKRKVGLT